MLQNTEKKSKYMYMYWLEHSLKENSIHDQVSDMKGLL